MGFFSSNVNTSVCESYWEDCDDSIFSEMCDTIDTIKVNVNEEVQNNEVNLTNSENAAKRKYCATECNKPQQQLIVEERKNNMIKKLKKNSLFKC